MREKNIHPLEIHRLEERLRAMADGIRDRREYYTETKEGQQEMAEAARQAGKLAGEAGKLAWAIARGIAGGTAHKARDCVQAGNQVAKGDYRGAGKTVAEMEIRRLNGMRKAVGEAAGAVANGVKLLGQEQDKEAARTTKRQLHRQLRNCVIAGGAILLGAELVDELPGMDDLDDGVFPDTDVGDMEGVTDGMLVDASPENINSIAEAGEIPDTDHGSDFTRSSAIRTAFLQENGWDEAPPGWAVHHVVPLCEGGADDPSNMLLLRSEDHAWITAQHRRVYDWPLPPFWQNASG